MGIKFAPTLVHSCVTFSCWWLVQVRALRHQHVADALARLAADEQAAYTRDALQGERHVSTLIAQLQRIIGK